MKGLIEVVSFDFDGVFPPNSDAVHKPAAYRQVLQHYRGYEAYLEEAEKRFASGKRGGRKEILDYVFQRLGEPATRIPALVEIALRNFNRYVQEKIKEDGLTPHSLEALEELSALPITYYLNSGTATSALEECAQALGITGYFEGVLGSTPEPVGGSKLDNLIYISRKECVLPQAILVVGDGEPDLIAAEQFGCRFLGFANKWNKWADSRQKFEVVSDLREVVHFL